MNASILEKKIDAYEIPDFVDLDEVYGFSQDCASGTAQKSCKSPCSCGM